MLVIQDDAIVCRNFAESLERLIRVIPNHPVCLFYPGLKMRSLRAVRNAVAKKRSLFVLDRADFVPVVAVLWPIALAGSLLEWTRGRTIPGLRKPYRSDDAVTGAWMKHTRQDVYVTLPSLVQHPDVVASVKGGPHEPSGGNDPGRVAFSFCEDAAGIEWCV